MKRGGTYYAPVALTFLFSVCLCPRLLLSTPQSASVSAANDKISFEVLTALIINHDPSLEALRGAIADADFRLSTVARGRDPEIRVRYGALDGWSVPGAYTERSTQTGAGGGIRDTTTTVIPARGGETVTETVMENGSVVEESTTQTDFGRDLYAGRNSYSVQLRLFPRNPFLSSAARDRELAAQEHTKRALETALHRAALSVARDYREIQFMRAEEKLMQQRSELLRADLARLAELNTAQGINPADYHRQRTEALIHFTRLDELKARLGVASSKLKARASLGRYDHINYDGELMPAAIDFSALDQVKLKTLASERNPDLGAVQSTEDAVENALETLQAESLPWFSAVSVNYGIDDADNGQTRDEWGVFAGVTLPVGSWLDDAPRAALKGRLGSIRRQELLTRRQLDLAVESLCHSLGAVQAAWLRFSADSREIEQGITQQRDKIVGNDLNARQTHMSLNESLNRIAMQRLGLAQAVDALLFNLCDTVGCDFATLLAVGMPPAADASR